MNSTPVLTPKFIVDALSQCLDNNVVPSIRAGEGGNSHSVWFISFRLLEGNKLHHFAVKITSSYSQQFLDFVCFSGLGFDGLTEFRNMADCIRLAKANVKNLVVLDGQ